MSPEGMRGLLPILSMHGMFLFFSYFGGEVSCERGEGKKGKGGRGLWMDGWFELKGVDVRLAVCITVRSVERCSLKQHAEFNLNPVIVVLI